MLLINAECVLLGRNFDFLDDYLLVTARYLVVAAGYLVVLVVTAFRRCLCDNWKPSFLHRLIFNWRTFTARW